MNMCHVQKKSGADQPAHMHNLISTIVVYCIDSMKYKLLHIDTCMYFKVLSAVKTDYRHRDHSILELK